MHTSNLREMRQRVERAVGRRVAVEGQLKGARAAVKQRQATLHHWEQAQAVIQTVAQETQRALAYRISEPVSLAMATVFPNPYTFQLEFVTRRNQAEADLSFIRDAEGEALHPIAASGGGAVDVAAFAMRVALWQLARAKARPVLVLDEPFRFVSRNLQTKASLLLKEVSDRLGLQMIIVSHETRLMECADKVFTVAIEDGVSRVE